jgi:uncharacterized protein with FMN-binding domain
MDQKNVSKLVALFSVLTVAVGAAGCGTATDTTPTTSITPPADGSAMTGSDTQAGTSAASGQETVAGSDTGSAMTPPPTTMTPSNPPPATPSTPAPQPATNKSTYKDGSYTAEGSYASPGGTEGVTVTLTLKDDVVTGVTVAPGANDPMSTRYQNMFIGGISGIVVGKKLDAIAVGKVSGSSLTAGGFNQAVTKIKAEAKA